MAVGRAKGHRRIGRFEAYFEVAEGYLGPLWAAKVVTGPGSGLVALVREVSVTGEAAERMLAASNRATALSHRGVLRPLEVGRNGSDGIFVATDYVEGETLRALQGLSSVRRKPIDVGVALRIATDLLEALIGLHAGAQGNGIFGGVSPDSIYVDTQGQTWLLDIGVGAPAASLEAFGGQSERIAYLAPEQVDRYDATIADARTDVFSAGVLLWEMLSNRRLFIGSDRAVAQKVLAGKIPPLDQVKRRGDFDLSPALVALVARALERDPAARFASVSEMLSALGKTGSAASTPDEVASLIKAVGETSIERRVDAMRDETGKPSTDLLSRVSSPPTGARDRAPGAASVSPRGATPAAPAAQAARPALPAPPAAPAKASGPVGAASSGAPARARFKTMVGIAPPSGLGPDKVPPPIAFPLAPTPPESAPMSAEAISVQALSVGPVSADPTSVGRPTPEPPSSNTADDYPDSAFEPVGVLAHGGTGWKNVASPLEPVRPHVRDAIEAGAGWPPAPPDPPLGRSTPDAPLPRPPHLPGTAPFSRPDSLPRSVPSPVGLSAPRAASMPPASLFPSKVPPPLIHDPRAKVQQQQEKSSGRGVLIVVIAVATIFGVGIALGLYVVQTQEGGSGPETTAAPETPEPVVTAAPEPEATASAPEAASAVPAATGVTPAASGPAAPVESAAPSATASAPPAASAPLTGVAGAPKTTSAPPAPVTTYRPRTRPPKKFQPDDI